MNVTVGVDLVEVARIAYVLQCHPVRFLTRHFTAAEQTECGRNPERLATRWAAKEAAAKALGTGIGTVSWHEIEVLCRPSGAPVLALHGAAGRLAGKQGWQSWSVSLSHTGEHAVAVVAGVGWGAGTDAGDHHAGSMPYAYDQPIPA